VFTLPACTQIIVGPLMGGSASTRMRPWLSVGILTTRLRPRPRIPSDFVTDGCASTPTITVIEGAPGSPSASTFQPTRLSTAWRAAASAQRLATVAPVTKAPPHSGGNRRTSSNQRSATCSSVAVPGVARCNALFWSHAEASQLAASATGSEPPITKPKKRGPAIPMVAGEPISSSRRRVSRPSVGTSGSGSSNVLRLVIADGAGATGRVSRSAR
jgi:hypothetical protein